MSAASSGILDVYERNQEATLWVGNLDAKMDEDLLWEIFVQCGPLQTVNIPKDKITGMHQGFAFVEFKNEEDADYGVKIMQMIKIFGKPIRCTKATAECKKSQDIGANLFVGNLDPLCDDKTLYDTFASFGHLLFAKVMKDPDTGASREFGFISYDSFEASDAAMVAMNGQFLCNSPVQVSYAYKKESRGERHGDASERLLAANKPSQIPAEHIPAPQSLAHGHGLHIPGGPAPPIAGRGGGAPPPPRPGGPWGGTPGFSKGFGGMEKGGKNWGKGW